MARPTPIARAGIGLAVLACALGTLLAPAGCGMPAAAPTPQRPAPVRLAIGYGGPGNVANVGLRGFAYLISTEKLVQVRRDGRIEPGLAERWEQSADGLTWRFHIRPRLTFHDGTPLDAPVVADRLQASLTQTPRNPGFRDVVRIHADDARILVFTLRRPSGLLLDSLGLLAIARDDSETIGAGPYRRLPGGDGEGKVSFEAFAQYYRGHPAIDRVEFQLYPNARNAWAAMMRGEIDMLYEVAPEALDFIEQSSDTQVRSFLRPYVYTMNLNLRHPVLSSKEVRLALNQAVNRTAIITQVFRGHAYPATDHVWPRHWAYDHTLPRLHYDPAETVRLLEARGLALPASAGPGEHTPSRFRFTCIIPEHDMRFERIALMLQRQLMEVGIDMQLEPLSWADLGRRVTTGRFDAFLVDFISTAGLDRLYQAWHSPDTVAEYFDSGYTSANAVLDRLLTARNDDETRAATQELQRVMREDPPAVFLVWPETARAVSSRFRVPLSPDRDVFSSLPRWQLATAPPSTATAP